MPCTEEGEGGGDLVHLLLQGRQVKERLRQHKAAVLHREGQRRFEHPLPDDLLQVPIHHIPPAQCDALPQ